MTLPQQKKDQPINDRITRLEVVIENIRETLADLKRGQARLEDKIDIILQEFKKVQLKLEDRIDRVDSRLWAIALLILGAFSGLIGGIHWIK